MYILPTVAVLMSTYNGEKYLSTQIDSIINQEGVEISLFIRDDCSTDETIKILSRYSHQENIHVIYGKKNLKPANSFMELLYNTHGFDYYAFADQDDIWLEDKLITAVNKISTYQTPALYCSNQIILEGDKEKHKRYEDNPSTDLVRVLFSNSISGCTMLMNNSLASVLSSPENRPRPNVLSLRMHDTWVLLVAILTGNVVYDDEGHILYRIHENNMVGVRSDNASCLDRILSSLKNNGIFNKTNYRRLYARELLKCRFTMRKEDKEVLRRISDYQVSLRDKMTLLKDKAILERSGESRLSYIGKILFDIL